MANYGPFAAYVRDNAPTGTVGWSAVTPWAASTVVAAGVLRRQLATPAVGAERVFVSVVGGTTGASEPAWTVTQGGKTTDNTVTWIEVTGQPAVNGDTAINNVAATNAATASGNVLHFAAVPANIAIGQFVQDLGAIAQIPPQTTVTNFTPTTVTISNPVASTVSNGLTIGFSNTNQWADVKTTPVALGYIVQGNGGGYLYVVTTAGTTGSTYPLSGTTPGGTVNDNGVIWTCLGACSVFTAWNAPHARIANALGWLGAGSSVFVGDDHAETQATGITIQGSGTAASPCSLVCYSHTASMPAKSSGTSSGATVTCSGTAATLALAGYFDSLGIAFKSAATAGSGISLLVAGAGRLRLDSGSLGLTAASGAAVIAIFASTGLSSVVLNSTALAFGAAGQGVFLGSGRLAWRNTASAVSGTAPTTLLASAAAVAALAILDGVDLSLLGGASTIVGTLSGPQNVVLANCKLGSSVTVAASQSAGGGRVDVAACDGAATNYQTQRYWAEGALTTTTGIVRTGGANSGGTAVAFQIATSAGAQFEFPFEATPAAIWNNEIVQNATVTMRGLWNAAVVPNNDQIWLDVEYMGASGSPLSSLGSQTKANLLAAGTALTADTSAWDSQVATRANTTAYTVGQIITVGSGQVWWCTTGGTTAASQPAGYTGAADGASVTDGTAVFRAGCRFLLQVVLSSPQPQIAGYLRANVKAALASSMFWVDPLVTLS